MRSRHRVWRLTLRILLADLFSEITVTGRQEEGGVGTGSSDNLEIVNKTKAEVVSEDTKSPLACRICEDLPRLF